MTVSELREKLAGVADDMDVAVGLPVKGGVMPMPLGNATDIKDQDGNPWLLLIPATPCSSGGCDGCDGGCEDTEADEADGTQEG